MWRLVGLVFEAEILKQNMPVAKERVYYLSVREVAPSVTANKSLNWAPLFSNVDLTSGYQDNVLECYDICIRFPFQLMKLAWKVD